MTFVWPGLDGVEGFKPLNSDEKRLPEFGAGVVLETLAVENDGTGGLAAGADGTVVLASVVGAGLTGGSGIEVSPRLTVGPLGFRPEGFVSRTKFVNGAWTRARAVGRPMANGMSLAKGVPVCQFLKACHPGVASATATPLLV